MNGIFLVNKPKGLTSHDVVYQIKRKFNLKKVGHTGTLDPFATGLMIILCGNATKLAFLFNDLDKGYCGTIILNQLYDTYDNTGKLIDAKKVKVNSIDLTTAIKELTKTYEQVPPIYSAIKIDGKKAYQLARQGEKIELPARLVTIYLFNQLSSLIDDSFDFEALVSKGTYIRSLAFDLGVKLKTYGALSELKRTLIGKYSIDNAKTIEDITKLDLISDQDLFSNIHHLELSEYLIKLVKNGVYLDQRQIETTEPFIVVDHKGNQIAYYEVIDSNKYKPVYFFDGK